MYVIDIDVYLFYTDIIVISYVSFTHKYCIHIKLHLHVIYVLNIFFNLHTCLHTHVYG